MACRAHTHAHTYTQMGAYVFDAKTGDFGPTVYAALQDAFVHHVFDRVCCWPCKHDHASWARRCEAKLIALLWLVLHLLERTLARS